MTEWSPNFLVLRPSAAKVFAIEWQKRITALLEERKNQEVNSEVLQESFKTTVEESSSLPVRDHVYRLITLHCAVFLLAFYHLYGDTIDTKVKAYGWADTTYGRYFRLLRRHGIGFFP